MAELLIELFSEEIPSRMQNGAKNDFARMASKFLKDAGLEIGAVSAFVTPRRLALKIDDVPLSTPDLVEERKGPQTSAPERAIEGFLKSAGVTLEQCEKQEIKGKEFYVAKIEKTGVKTADVIAEQMPELIKKFPWPKSMRWGSGNLRWVRPLQSILCLLDGEVVEFSVEHLTSSNTTQGHLFLANDRFEVKDFADYQAKLLEHKVVLDQDERAKLILEKAKAACADAGVSLIEDEDLIKETTGLVEWPTALIGSFEQEYLDVPKEVIIETIKGHQKCFSLTEKGSDKLTNHFLTISNMIAKDGGKIIVHGNEKVIRARLSDAKFFWDTDQKVKLEDRVEKLKNITFHAKIGSQFDRVNSIKELAEMLCEFTGADAEKVLKAAHLCKADLLTNMVGELPELQGYMGHHYALAEGMDAEIAEALELHYAPIGPSDNVPDNKVAITLSLADKFNTLLGFWAIDEKPTGSKDPYALRRAALGIIRTILEKNIRFDIPQDLMPFFVDRLKVFFKDQGLRHDLIDAIFSLKNQNDIALAKARIEALDEFLKSDDGINLLAGVKRASNILKIEEKKDDQTYGFEVDEGLLKDDAEKALYQAVIAVIVDLKGQVEREEFSDAMKNIASLRPAVDGFFEVVKVNDDDAAIRANRLKLLTLIRQTTMAVADFSKIEG